MAGAGVAIEVDAQARAIREGEAAVGRIDGRSVVHELAHPRVGEVVEVLDDVHVPRRDREMDVGRRGDGPADVVRRQGEVVRLGPGRPGGASR